MSCQTITFRAKIYEAIELKTTICEVPTMKHLFDFQATVNGENHFTLPAIPIANSVVMGYEGMLQNPVGEVDFSISGAILIVPNMEIGDGIYGYYEI